MLEMLYDIVIHEYMGMIELYLLPEFKQASRIALELKMVTIELHLGEKRSFGQKYSKNKLNLNVLKTIVFVPTYVSLCLKTMVLIIGLFKNELFFIFVYFINFGSRCSTTLNFEISKPILMIFCKCLLLGQT